MCTISTQGPIGLLLYPKFEEPYSVNRAIQHSDPNTEVDRLGALTSRFAIRENGRVDFPVDSHILWLVIL